MKDKRISRKRLFATKKSGGTNLLVVLLLIIVAALTLFIYLRNNNQKAQDYYQEFTYKNTTQLNPEEGQQDSANVKGDIKNGTAIITVATGYENALNSKLDVSNVSVHNEPPYQVLRINVNQDLSNALGSPANPRILIEVPNIQAGKIKVEVNISIREPDFSQEQVKMKTVETKKLETELTYSTL